MASEDQSSILLLLKLLDRPRNAIASAVQGTITGDEDKTFLRGLMGDTETSWGDVVGIDAPTSEDDWATYLSRGAGRLILDAALDPLLGVGKLKLPAQALRLAPVRAAADAVSGSDVGKWFLHGAIGRPEFNEQMTKRLFMSKEGSVEAAKAYKTVGEELAARGITEEQLPKLREALERPELAKQYGFDQATLDVFNPLRNIDTDMLNQYNAAAVRAGLPEWQKMPVEGIEYIPRILTQKGEGALYDVFKPGRGMVSSTVKPLESRQLLRLEDMSGEAIRTAEGAPIVTKETDEFLKKWGVTEKGGDYYLKDTGQKVKFGQASLADIEASGVAPKRSFVTDPALSLLGGTYKKEGRANFLNFVADGLESGEWLKVAGKEAIPEGWRPLRIAGMETYHAPKWAANQVENAAQIMLDPGSALGSIETAFKGINDSVFGKALQAYTSVWKRATLAHPGWLFGNVVSNQVQEFLRIGGLNIAKRDAEAIALQSGKGEIIPGLSNEILREEAAKRGLWQTSWGASEARTDLEKATRAKPSEAITMKLGKTGEAAQWAIDKGGQAQDLVFKLGGWAEDNAKGAVFIDYLKNHLKHGEVVRDPQQISQLLDRAVMDAQNAIGNFARLTPMENMLKTYVPFLNWYRHVISRALIDLGERPEKIARVGRFWDFAFDPMTKAQEEIALDWMKTQGPATGILGWKPTTESGEPGIMLTSRFNPYGNLEDLARRPLDFLMGIANPALKIPFEAAGNKNLFKGGPMDPLAKSGLDALLGPVTGAPHGLAPDRMFGQLVPAGPAHMAEYIPGFRYVREANVLTGGQEGPEQASKMSPAERVTWYLTGGKTFPFDEARQTQRKRLEGVKELTGMKSQMKYATQRGDSEAAEFYANQYMRALLRAGAM